MQIVYVFLCKVFIHVLCITCSGDTTLPDLDDIVKMTEAARGNKDSSGSKDDSPVIVVNDEEFPPSPV